MYETFKHKCEHVHFRRRKNCAFYRPCSLWSVHELLCLEYCAIIPLTCTVTDLLISYTIANLTNMTGAVKIICIPATWTSSAWLLSWLCRCMNSRCMVIAMVMSVHKQPLHGYCGGYLGVWTTNAWLLSWLCRYISNHCVVVTIVISVHKQPMHGYDRSYVIVWTSHVHVYDRSYMLQYKVHIQNYVHVS